MRFSVVKCWLRTCAGIDKEICDFNGESAGRALTGASLHLTRLAETEMTKRVETCRSRENCWRAERLPAEGNGRAGVALPVCDNVECFFLWYGTVLCCSFYLLLCSDCCGVVLSARRTFGKAAQRQHPVVRPDSDRQLLAHPPVSAEPTLARFRAVATVRCVKTPGLQQPFRSTPPLSRRTSRHPAKAAGM